MELLNVLSEFGFQVAVVVALMYYIVAKDKTHAAAMAKKDEQLARVMELHAQESKDMSTAIDKLTIVLERLSSKLDDPGTLGDDKK